MNFRKQVSVQDAEAGLEDVLKNFRSSVHAWSDAEFARPRAALLAEHRRSWRRVAAWALGCVLAAGSFSAGLYEHQHHEQLQRFMAESQARQRQMIATEQAAEAARQTRLEDEKLMAAVENDVSQQVPSAMEPLAQLMYESANQ